MKRCRMHIYYSGKVQGIGFRYTTKNVATGYEVTGIVRNLSDGRVELLAEGLKDELEAFQQGIRESGLGSFISNEELRWEDPSGEFAHSPAAFFARKFRILRTTSQKPRACRVADTPQHKSRKLES